MTSFDLLPQDTRARVLARLRQQAAEWLAAFYRHEVLVARAVRGAQLEAETTFDRIVVRPLLREIAGQLAVIKPRTGDLAADLFPGLLQLRADIERTVKHGSDAVRDLVLKRMDSIAENEARWVHDTAKRADPDVPSGPLVPAHVLETELRNRTFLGEKVETWFQRDLEAPTSNNVRAWVTTGVSRGLSVDEITSGLKGTRSQPGILSDKPTFAVRALTRTASTHAITTARQESYKALGVTHWRFVATLDLRTSLICASEDGNIYPIGEGPVPPLHPNCRSATAPVLDQSKPRSGTRASMHGPVPATTTFEKWLETLPVADQNHILGKTKAEAWRSGALTLKDMLGKDLQPLTIEELKRDDKL